MAKSNMELVEKTYNELYDFLMNKCENAELYRKLFKANHESAEFIPFPEAQLYKVLCDLKDAIAQETAKASGKGKIREIMMRIIRNADESRPQFKGAYTDTDGSITVTDSYIMVHTMEKVDLPPAPIAEGERWFDYKKIIPDTFDMREVQIPSIQELKTYIKLNRKNKDVCHVHGSAVVYFITNDKGQIIQIQDAKRLLNALEAVGDNAKAYVSWSYAATRPIRIEAGDTTVVSCPVRPFTLAELKRNGFEWEDKDSVWGDKEDEAV